MAEPVRHHPRLLFQAVLVVVAALSAPGCGNADNPVPPKTTDERREEWKQSTAKEEAVQAESKQRIAELDAEIRKNDEQIKALRAENQALKKQLEATSPPAPAPTNP